MYLDKKRLPNGRYKYLVKCVSCPDVRWVMDTRGKRCKACSVKSRTLNSCLVWPRHCRRCNKPMLLKFKPKEDRKPTCNVCKGKYGGRKAMPKTEKTKIEKPRAKKTKVKKSKIKCSECPTKFEPVAITSKTCGKVCSLVRKKRLRIEGKKGVKNPQSRKEYTDGIFSKIRLKLDHKPKTELGGVDENDKPEYIREPNKKRLEFKEHNTGPTDDEISSDLISKYLKNGGNVTVIGNPGPMESVSIRNEGVYYG